MDNLDIKNLKKTWRRLVKNTSNFKNLIVRDTLDFLDYKIELEKNLKVLIFEINNTRYHPTKPYLLPFPKDKGISRPTVVFDAVDSLVFRFCIEQIEDDLIEEVRKVEVNKDFAVYGGFKITPKKSQEVDDEEFYEKWLKDWKNLIKLISKALESKVFLAKSDITAYFENINLLILKDLVRSTVKEKSHVVNLLFYFLENIIFRHEYSANSFIGIPQEDIDCSRLLAFFLLNKLDIELKDFCTKNNISYYRWVDDINIIADSEVLTKKALRVLSESLRKLGLTASLEKTQILSKDDANKLFCFEENYFLDNFEKQMDAALKGEENLEDIKKQIEEYYELKKVQINKKPFAKILKRFYKILAILKSDILLDELKLHLLEYQEVLASKKLYCYLCRNQNSSKFNSAIEDLINYLYSDENLYPQLETNLIETLLYLDPKTITSNISKKIAQLGENIFFRTNNYNPLSEYSRALALLLIFRFNQNILNKIIKHYLNYEENDFVLKKYLIFVCLTTDNLNLCNKVIEKARREQNFSISRLVSFIDNIDIYIDKKEVKDYINNNFIYIYKNEDNNEWIKEYYNPIRVEILKVLINRFKKTS